MILVQTYVENPSASVYSRMPSASEMREWVKRIVLARKTEVAGMAWYCWDRIAGHYQKWLKRDRYDDTGADRWNAMREIGRRLRSINRQRDRSY